MLILLGPPGAGKGTQASRLAAHLGLPHVATGDLFRENLSQGTALGQRAKSFMESGKLVPDELVLEMLFDRVSRPDCAGGYLLDGFPRTLPQAEALTERLAGLSVSTLSLEVPDDQLVERASGRLLCKSCSNIHHATFSPPRVAGVCDACGGELYRRKDDDPAVVRERLAVFHEQTQPMIDYYARQGSLESIDGTQSPDDVFASLLARLDAGTSAGGRA
ncbi:MAG: adenylate kinase [Planctomycetes bacterium]|nr:adenylate kinase [Planctomycetota bacterium]